MDIYWVCVFCIYIRYWVGGVMVFGWWWVSVMVVEVWWCKVMEWFLVVLIYIFLLCLYFLVLCYLVMISWRNVIGLLRWIVWLGFLLIILDIYVGLCWRVVVGSVVFWCLCFWDLFVEIGLGWRLEDCVIWLGYGGLCSNW